jgi:anti-sigma B factor antagonist
VDSAGLGQLVQIHATTKSKGGSLRLANVTKRLKDLLVVTKLVTVFDSYDSEADAVGSFS